MPGSRPLPAPIGLESEILTTKEFGGSMVICGSRGPRNLKGDSLKTALREFADHMEPQITHTLESLNNLIILYEAWNMSEKAEEWQVELLQTEVVEY